MVAKEPRAPAPTAAEAENKRVGSGSCQGWSRSGGYVPSCSENLGGGEGKREGYDILTARQALLAFVSLPGGGNALRLAGRMPLILTGTLIGLCGVAREQEGM